MTYRRFLKVLKASRAAAVPSVPHPHAKPRANWAWRAAALVAAAAILVGGIAIFAPRDTAPEKPPVDNPATPIFETVEVLPALHAGLPSGAENAIVCRTLFAGGNTDGDHALCSGVYYNPANGSLFCCTHAAEELIKANGLSADTIRIKCFVPQTGKVLFTLGEERGAPVYCGDLTTDALLPVQADLYAAGTWMGGSDTPTAPYAVFSAGDESAALLVIDLDTAEVSRLSDTYPSVDDDAALTRGGRFVHYLTSRENGGTTVLYDPVAHTFVTLAGVLLDSTPDDSLLLLRTPDGLRVYHSDSGTVTAVADSNLPAAYLYGVCEGERFTEDTHTLLIENRLTGKKTPLVEDVSAYTQNADRAYLYYYRRGEKSVHQYHIESGEDTLLPLDPRLAEETESAENRDRSVLFTMTYPADNRSVLLEYRPTANARQDPVAVRQERERSPWWNYQQWMQNGGQTIASMAGLLQKFPETVTAYEGDGFITLDITALVETDNRVVLLEDYTDGRGYSLAHQGASPSSPLQSLPKEWYALTKSDESAARAALEAAGIPLLPAETDYLSIIRLDKDDPLAAHLATGRTERIFSDIGGYFLYDKTFEDADSRWALESAEDMAQLHDFLTFTDTLSYQAYLGDSERWVDYAHAATHLLRLSLTEGQLDIYIGKKDGAAFIMKDHCVAALTDTAYNKWSTWMNTQRAKCFVDPYA